MRCWRVPPRGCRRAGAAGRSILVADELFIDVDAGVAVVDNDSCCRADEWRPDLDVVLIE